MINKYRILNASLLAAAALAGAGLTGCTRAEQDKTFSYGQEAKVVQTSGGKVVYAGISQGKISIEDGSDGYYFADKCNNGKLAEVSGDITFTRSGDTLNCDDLPPLDPVVTARRGDVRTAAVPAPNPSP